MKNKAVMMIAVMLSFCISGCAPENDGNDYRDILYEELEYYFKGGITEDMLIDHLNNRVGLYLKETQ